MILLVRKRNVLLIAATLVFSMALYFTMPFLESGLMASGTAEDKKTVLIDPGHGGEDPGAVSDYNQVKEKDINLSVALSLRDNLNASGYNVVMTRDSDILQYDDSNVGVTKKRYQDLLKRKKLMDETNPNIIVSIHMNKIAQTELKGAQTFFPKDSAESKKLADSIQNKIIEIADTENKRVALVKKDQPPIVIFREVKNPITVVECGFLSNPDEAQKLATKDYQEKLVKAIKAGIDSYFTVMP